MSWVNYINSLAEKKDLTDASDVLKAWLSTPVAIENATNIEVNMLLDALKALPWKPKPKPDNPFIATPEQPNAPLPPTGKPAPEDHTPLNKSGRYFIVDPTDGVEKFVVVGSVQASDYLYPVQEPVHRNAILKAISVDPVNAMNEYGMKLGVCGVCGRTLTNRDSRLRGMGPICAGRFGMVATPEQIDMLDKLGLRKKDPGEPDNESEIPMATVNSREVVDQIIKGDGYYPGNRTRVIKIVQYNNQYNGGLAYGLIYQGEDPTRYDNAPACHNPQTLWQVSN